MSTKLRILLTGASGYIGSAIGRDLEAAGHTVVGVSRRAPEARARPADAESAAGKHQQRTGSPENLRSAYRPAESVVCDLGDADATARTLADLEPCSVIVHTAAATGPAADRAESGEGLHPSLGMLQNLYAATRTWNARWIHLSSVSVYGDADRSEPVRVDDTLRPATVYGRAKLACEEFLSDHAPADCRILRITPVYSANALRNVAVRVYLPGTPLRLRILPEPRHSLCALDTLVQRVREHVADGEKRVLVEHTTDADEHAQHALARQFPRGPLIRFPEIVFRPMYVILGWLPGRAAYQLRCVYWKLFRSNLYEPPQLQLGGSAPTR